MAKFKALLFDLDGTLVDSEHFHFNTWNELLAESNIQLEYSDFLKNYAGIPLPGNAQRLKELYEIESPLELLISRKEDLTVERLKTSVIDLMPHVQDTLDFFRSKGIVMALVTASKRADVDEMFRKNGLDKYFSLLITRSDVTHSKPDPESYNLAVEKLGLQKSECLVFEDTLNGLRAAKAAGLTCFAIQANTDDHLKLSAADKIFLDFQSVKDFLKENDLI
ncbi:HAD family hydrolase [Pedobacter hartonius]|uniref:Haloacid dehalogenase superfamily, subfamily IA, variant 3 with third motif having DD or ED/haloacid dehalogenase superfamily, subfamily IA, variant 1 with third motif having Dx(3-4)D or Dx(3-4)E n=1 Tax=Pedobacter hartonius TaxID=425514 RepID=A0A1H4BE60_9SPHI|nr:HAD family phosphatase [Pedobacter hartonius]SEA46112.1 haloacid dehalogenase superfamily, subfamily IA, variant 3 with third motif having DD or ED/haloacid dehalogenase superfamily, subfamily IA, variant 1 with third motif having Dx(3-4)D or Dx(3-4)E [Pedobacter hartonius]